MGAQRAGSVWRMALVAAWLIGLPAASGAAETTPAAKPWDAARLEDLSGRLADAVQAVREAFRREPAYTQPQNRRAAKDMDHTLRLLGTSSRQLASRIQAGGGRAETEPIARKIGSLLNDAQVDGRKLMTTQWMDEKARPAKELINEIAPYYGSGPLYDPETMKRIEP
jgi:hypothetical protein